MCPGEATSLQRILKRSMSLFDSSSGVMETLKHPGQSCPDVPIVAAQGDRLLQRILSYRQSPSLARSYSDTIPVVGVLCVYFHRTLIMGECFFVSAGSV
jgi:hypothetical protein